MDSKYGDVVSLADALADLDDWKAGAPPWNASVSLWARGCRPQTQSNARGSPEQAGYESAWVVEASAHGGDQFSLLTAIALATTRIRSGTFGDQQCLPVRTAPTIAMAAACIDHFSSGRFVLGLGSSHKVQVEVEHGVHYTEPVTRVRETVEVVCARCCATARSPFAARPSPSSIFDLWFKPAHTSVPIYLSALFPQMLWSVRRNRPGPPDGVQHARFHARRLRTSIRRSRARRAQRQGNRKSPRCCPRALRDRKTAYDSSGVRPVLAFYVGYFPAIPARRPGGGPVRRRRGCDRRGLKRGDSERTLAAVPDAKMVAELTASGTAA